MPPVSLLSNIFLFITYLHVTGSIPDGAIGIFHWHNPSGRTMVLGVKAAGM
jgi:hypothetical protein